MNISSTLVALRPVFSLIAENRQLLVDKKFDTVLPALTQALNAQAPTLYPWLFLTAVSMASLTLVQLQACISPPMMKMKHTAPSTNPKASPSEHEVEGVRGAGVGESAKKTGKIGLKRFKRAALKVKAAHAKPAASKGEHKFRALVTQVCRLGA